MRQLYLRIGLALVMVSLFAVTLLVVRPSFVNAQSDERASVTCVPDSITQFTAEETLVSCRNGGEGEPEMLVIRAGGSGDRMVQLVIAALNNPSLLLLASGEVDANGALNTDSMNLSSVP